MLSIVPSSSTPPAKPSSPSCRSEPGAIVPIVDHGKCEAKGDCVNVCPYDVFEVRKIDPADYRALSWLGKLKNRVHGGKVAYTPNADACRNCGLCVQACPERAIQLRREDRRDR